jgi:hypothetical protein
MTWNFLTRMSRVRALLGLLVLLALPLQLWAFDHSHAAFTDVLSKHVRWNSAGTSTAVGYAGIQKERAALSAYTKALSAVTNAEFQGFTKPQRQAFLINAYNAFTLELILSKYPKLKSIKDLGSLLSSPWKKEFVPFLGKTRSLDDIEHGLLRGAKDFDEPRIHFAVNCASIGCPALRPEAFRAEQLTAQLIDQTQRFLRDRTRNRWNAEEQTLEISSIFDWYEGDFERGYLGAKSVSQFLAGYQASLGLTRVQLEQLKRGELAIDYTEYDWLLNDKTR